jgi:taurine dioxygenase
MTAIDVKPLADDLPFGARITGVTLQNSKDAQVREQVNQVFHDRGMIIFEEMEPSNALQVAVSEIFGQLEDHALSDVPMADDEVRGMTDFTYQDIFEIDGKEMSGWIPWHFDACYAEKLNRGIQMYAAIERDLRDKFENLNIIYHSHLMFTNLKFGRPQSYKGVKVRKMITDMLDATKDAPRSVHPAIWTRKTGEKVLHVSPWQAAGIEGMENEEGDRLLAQLVDEMNAKMLPYFHTWKPTDMAIWDNWRFVHAASGNPPQYPRRMQRTTIQGDYGLGRLEIAGSAAPVGVDV